MVPHFIADSITAWTIRSHGGQRQMMYHLVYRFPPFGDSMPAVHVHLESGGAAGARAPAARKFWVLSEKGADVGARRWQGAFNDLVGRVMSSSSVVLFDAVEAGVPTYLVDVIAGATGQAASSVMEIIGVSATTFRRKEDAHEPLPDVAGHRIMGFLRVAATLRRLLDESGDPAQLQGFDLNAWLAQWMREELPELGGKTPAEMLRNHEGLRAIEQVLERMRGGLPA